MSEVEMLVQEIRDLRSRVKALEDRIARLHRAIDNLEGEHLHWGRIDEP